MEDEEGFGGDFVVYVVSCSYQVPSMYLLGMRGSGLYSISMGASFLT